MSRILFWIALVFLVLFAVRAKLRGMRQPPPGASNPQQPSRPRQTELPLAEPMLCCSHCGLYYPESETVQLNGRDYCSPAHAGLPQR